MPTLLLVQVFESVEQIIYIKGIYATEGKHKVRDKCRE